MTTFDSHVIVGVDVAKDEIVVYRRDRLQTIAESVGARLPAIQALRCIRHTALSCIAGKPRSHRRSRYSVGPAGRRSALAGRASGHSLHILRQKYRSPG